LPLLLMSAVCRKLLASWLLLSGDCLLLRPLLCCRPLFLLLLVVLLLVHVSAACDNGCPVPHVWLCSKLLLVVLPHVLQLSLLPAAAVRPCTHRCAAT
jgi:hypothetical protein